MTAARESRAGIGPGHQHRLWWSAFLILAVAALAAFSVFHIVEVVHWWVVSGGGADWPNLAGATDGNPYDTAGFRWSPVAASLLMAIVPIGLPLWQLAHGAALVLLRPWWAVLAVLLWWPFWHDVMNGNVMTFIFIAGWFALRGHRVGTYAIYAMALLMPRPLMVPIAVWLLWRQRDTWLVFVGLAAVHTALVLASGHADDWITRLLETAGPEMQHPWNWLPSRWIGLAWVPIGLVIAAALTRYGWVGFASIAASPYVFPYYWLLVLWDLPRIVSWIQKQLDRSRGIGSQLTSAQPHRDQGSARGSPSS